MNPWKIAVVSLLVVGFVMLFSFLSGKNQGDFELSDPEHGCLIVVGYFWNESEQECVRGKAGGGSEYQINDFISCVDAGYQIGESYPRQCRTPGGRLFFENVDLFAIFSEQLRRRAIDRLGAVPVEGFDPNMYLNIFPGLIESDFNGSESFGGEWVYEYEGLTFMRKNYLQISSVDQSLTSAGILQLYKNIQRRLGINVQRISDIEEIFRVIEGGANWDEDEILLMRNVLTGEYGCFGCNSESCKEPVSGMVSVEEVPEFHCGINFNLVGVREEYVPLPQFFSSDPNCPSGQTGKYGLDGLFIKLIDCKPLPSDLGKICKQDSDCEFGCVTTSADILNVGCDRGTCKNDSISCEGIRGRCSVYGKEDFRVFAPDLVSFVC